MPSMSGRNCTKRNIRNKITTHNQNIFCSQVVSNSPKSTSSPNILRNCSHLDM
uniref:Uncharacterized protein n=1 Tax=Rhizophora mucronata TaxID=61149 RepID=A0A2P2IY54_RHIMU